MPQKATYMLSYQGRKRAPREFIDRPTLIMQGFPVDDQRRDTIEPRGGLAV